MDKEKYATASVFPVFKTIKKGTDDYYYLQYFAAFECQKKGKRLRYLNLTLKDVEKTTYAGKVKILTGEDKNKIIPDVEIKSYKVSSHGIISLPYTQTKIKLNMQNTKLEVNDVFFDGERFVIGNDEESKMRFQRQLDMDSQGNLYDDYRERSLKIPEVATIKELEQIQENWNKDINKVINPKKNIEHHTSFFKEEEKTNVKTTTKKLFESKQENIFDKLSETANSDLDKIENFSADKREKFSDKNNERIDSLYDLLQE